MSLLFFDGFDAYGASGTTIFTARYSSLSSSFQWVTGRLGSGSAIRINNSLSTERIFSKTLTPSGGFVMGAAVRFTTNFGVTNDFFAIREGSSSGTGPIHLAVGCDSSGHLTVVRGTTVLATSTLTLNLNTWYYIEFKGTIHDTTGSYEVRVDGSTVSGLSATNVDTRNGLTGAWDNYSLAASSGNTTTGNVDFDDFYICDTSGSANNDFLGDSRVETRLPYTDAVSAGSNANFTPSTGTDHGAMVDETVPNGDTDYVASSTVGHIDTYKYPNLTLTGTVRGVQVAPYMEKTDAGTRTVNVVARVGSTNYAHATALSPGTTYAHMQSIFETNPATSAAWTTSEVNAAEFGVKVAS